MQVKQCAQCTDRIEFECALNQEWISSRNHRVTCPVLTGTPLCYTMIINQTRITRGCTAQAKYKEKLQRYCGLNRVHCYFCDEHMCNVDTVSAMTLEPGAVAVGSRVATASILLTVIHIIVYIPI